MDTILLALALVAPCEVHPFRDVARAGLYSSDPSVTKGTVARAERLGVSESRLDRKPPPPQTWKIGSGSRSRIERSVSVCWIGA
eukprot:13077022-Alexandrium_andersonii.AAC.1